MSESAAKEGSGVRACLGSNFVFGVESRLMDGMQGEINEGKRKS
jgi:hypothetical protein